LVIEHLKEGIEWRLLLEQVFGCGFGGYFFERQMRTLMTPLLLGSPGLSGCDLSDLSTNHP
jgi:hypothetical protein